MYLTNFNRVVSKEVVHNERKVLASGEEAQNLAVLVEELLLAGNLTATKLFLHEFLQVVLSGA